MLIRQAWRETEANQWNKKPANNNMNCHSLSQSPLLVQENQMAEDTWNTETETESSECEAIDKNKMTQYCESSKLMVKQANKRNNHHFFPFLFGVGDAFCWCFRCCTGEGRHILTHTYTNTSKHDTHSTICAYYVINIKIGSSRISPHKLSTTWWAFLFSLAVVVVVVGIRIFFGTWPTDTLIFILTVLSYALIDAWYIWFNVITPLLHSW